MRVTDLLRTMDIFENLRTEEIEAIARMLRERRLHPGDILTREGEVGDAMFLVTGGRIQLTTTDAAGNERLLTHFSDGDFFGEMSLITGAPRSATAVADSESRVLVLKKEDFDALLSTNPQVMREMLRVISQRTVQTNQQLIQDDNAGTTAVGAGKVIAIFSPRGGSGKSTIAVNLAVALARLLPERVGLVDLNLVFGHDSALLNVLPQASIAGIPMEELASFDRRTLSNYLTEHASSLQLIVGALQPEEGEAVTGEHVKAVLGVMKRQFMLTVVDCAPSFDVPTIAALDLADKVLMICTPELSTLRDVGQTHQVLFSEDVRLDKNKLVYALNHHQPFDVLTRERFESNLERPITLEIPHAGEAAMKAAVLGEPLAMNSGSAFVKTLERFAAEQIPTEMRPQARGGKPVRPVAAQRPSASEQSGTASNRPRGLAGLFHRAP